jgi:hypothetical protein
MEIVMKGLTGHGETNLGIDFKRFFKVLNTIF